MTLSFFAQMYASVCVFVRVCVFVSARYKIGAAFSSINVCVSVISDRRLVNCFQKISLFSQFSTFFARFRVAWICVCQCISVSVRVV